MTDTPPISWPSARANAALWLFHVSKAGPHTFDMTPAKYAEAVSELKSTVALLDIVVERKAQRERTEARS